MFPCHSMKLLGRGATDTFGKGLREGRGWPVLMLRRYVAHAHTHTHACTHTRMHAHTHACTHTHMHAHIPKFVCMHTHTHACTHTQICVHTHSHNSLYTTHTTPLTTHHYTSPLVTLLLHWGEGGIHQPTHLFLTSRNSLNSLYTYKQQEATQHTVELKAQAMHTMNSVWHCTQ